MKKLISLFLCALMVMSLSATAFAMPINGDDDATLNGTGGTTQPGAEPQSHTHSWEWVSTSNGGYQSQGNGCAQVIYRKWKCPCGATYESTETGKTEPHSGPVYAASCNGSTQTWQRTCSKCGDHYTTTTPCPGKDHKNGCQWLPV